MNQVSFWDMTPCRHICVFVHPPIPVPILSEHAALEDETTILSQNAGHQSPVILCHISAEQKPQLNHYESPKAHKTNSCIAHQEIPCLHCKKKLAIVSFVTTKLFRCPGFCCCHVRTSYGLHVDIILW